MRFDVQVETRPREGIADPEGSTIERSLPALGFEGIQDVRVGRSFRFHVEAEDEAAATSLVQDVCARFLTNPVLEGSTITVTAGSPV